MELPQGYTPDVQGSAMSEGELPGGGVLLTAQLDDPSPSSPTSRRSDPALATNRTMNLDVHGTRAQLLIRAWDDDPAWDEQVTRPLRRGLPALQALIGVDYPVSGRLSVEEAATSRLGEYAGIYNRVTGVIRVRYDADGFVTLHEAAHLWFNGDFFEDRWIGEAWAEFYGVTAGRRIGASGATFDLTDELLDSRIPLNDWGAIGVESLQVEDFAYAATYSLARRIADRADLAACVRSGRRPTRRRWPTSRSMPAAGWRGGLRPGRLAAAAGPAGGAHRRVVHRPVAGLGGQRRAAAAAGRAPGSAPRLRRDRGGSRGLGAAGVDPGRSGGVAVRRGARCARRRHEVLADRDQIEAAAADLELTPPDTLRAAFEGDGGLPAAAAEADAERDALAELDVCLGGAGR